MTTTSPACLSRPLNAHNPVFSQPIPYEKLLPSHEHALIGVSPFNSYFSVENMEKLFAWANRNFRKFHVFIMDGASVYNLMALGYSEKDATNKTKRNDRNLKNKVIKSLSLIGFDIEKSEGKILLLSNLSKNKQYLEIYNKCVDLFKNNNNFKNDCLATTHSMLAGKTQRLTDDQIYLAAKYLLAELPLWFNIPYILDINSSVLVYKDLSAFWQKICYDYNLLSCNQQILIKSVV